MGRVLIVGLDGATFDLIRPWVAQGRLPRLQALLAQGTAGELRSTVPPMSPPAWSSFMTGVNPGKHGIFDFTERKPGTYEIQFVSSRQRKAETIWKILSRAGKRVCAVGVPTTYPVEAVNGVMISGFDTPAMNEKAIHPPGLYAEIVEKVGEYILSSDVMRHVYDQRIDLAVETMLRCIRRKADIAKYLWAREPWDCFMVVFGETDSAIHYFWKHHDPQSPQYAPRPPGSNSLRKRSRLPACHRAGAVRLPPRAQGALRKIDHRLCCPTPSSSPRPDLLHHHAGWSRAATPRCRARGTSASRRDAAGHPAAWPRYPVRAGRSQ